MCNLAEWALSLAEGRGRQPHETRHCVRARSRRIVPNNEMTWGWLYGLRSSGQGVFLGAVPYPATHCGSLLNRMPSIFQADSFAHFQGPGNW